MNLKRAINNAKKLTMRSEKKGYIGDALNYAFRGHVLEILQQQTNILNQINKNIKKIKYKKNKRNPSEYNLYIAQELKKGNTFSEAINNWNTRKKQGESERQD